MILVGVDIGTSGCKIALYNEEGEQLAEASREYAVVTPHPGWVELEPDKVWQLFGEALQEVLRSLDKERDAYAMSFSFLGDHLIPASGDGTPLYRSITSSDTRSIRYAERIRREISEEELFSRTGRRSDPMCVLPRALWLREEMPGVFSSSVRLLDFQSYFLQRLGFEPKTDYSSAAGTMLYDIWNRCWSADMLTWAQIPEKMLPELVPPGTHIGTLSPEKRRLLGFPSSGQVHIVVGAMDQMCNALGTGTVAAGEMVCSTGTVECTTTVLPETMSDEQLRSINLCRVVSAIPGQFQTHTVLWTAGNALRWLREILTEPRGEGAGYSSYDELIGTGTSPPGVFFLPHLAGSGTPCWDSLSRGAFVGLTLATTREMVVDSLLEGVTFELRYNIEHLEKAGMQIGPIRVVGGGARSEKWMQMKADILGKTVATSICKNTGCLGAAILAGHGIGLYASLENSARRFAREKAQYRPRENTGEKYSQRYRVYRKIYPALREINAEISHMYGS